MILERPRFGAYENPRDIAVIARSDATAEAMIRSIPESQYSRLTVCLVGKQLYAFRLSGAYVASNLAPKFRTPEEAKWFELELHTRFRVNADIIYVEVLGECSTSG